MEATGCAAKKFCGLCGLGSTPPRSDSAASAASVVRSGLRLVACFVGRWRQVSASVRARGPESPTAPQPEWTRTRLSMAWPTTHRTGNPQDAEFRSQKKNAPAWGCRPPRRALVGRQLGKGICVARLQSRHAMQPMHPSSQGVAPLDPKRPLQSLCRRVWV